LTSWGDAEKQWGEPSGGPAWGDGENRIVGDLWGPTSWYNGPSCREAQEETTIVEFNTFGEAMQHLIDNFKKEYGCVVPPFFNGELSSAMQSAFESTSRPLAIYLHHRSIYTNRFVHNTLCQPDVTAKLNDSFVVWGWDVTSTENQDHLKGFMEGAEMEEIWKKLKAVSYVEYPLLITLVKKEEKIRLVETVKGPSSHNALLVALNSTILSIEPHEHEDSEKMTQPDEIIIEKETSETSHPDEIIIVKTTETSQLAEEINEEKTTQPSQPVEEINEEKAPSISSDSDFELIDADELDDSDDPAKGEASSSSANH